LDRRLGVVDRRGDVNVSPSVRVERDRAVIVRIVEP